MLVGLRLKNIALIESLELTFHEGFTVLTGETGAGKSILLEALDVLFAGNNGPNASRLIRSGASKSQIEANFLVDSHVKAWLKKEAFEIDQNDLLISREWHTCDKRMISRCRLNGTVVNRHQLTVLRPLLIDLTVQGAIHHLGASSQQLLFLDRHGSLPLQESLHKVNRSWKLWKNSFSKLQQTTEYYESLQKKSQHYQEILDELDSLNLEDPNEQNVLEKDQDRLVNGVMLQKSLSSLFSLLQEGTDQFPSALDQICLSIQELKGMYEYDSSLKIQLEKLNDIQVLLNDLNAELQDYGSTLESEPDHLDSIQERLSILKRIQRRHGYDLSELIHWRNKLRNMLESSSSENLLIDRQKEEAKFRINRDKDNAELTAIRQSVAILFEKKLMKYLRLLGLQNVQFKIQLTSSLPSESGADSVQFLFSANPGQPLAPISEIASGGEMSRFLLALKTILSEVDGTTTLLFDEIDSGVSGRISGAIASVLKDLSVNRQVFCVTHHPLVAAAADHHFSVTKSLVDGETRSEVSYLHDSAARQKELAELAGGDLAETKAYVASLLDQQAA